MSDTSAIDIKGVQTVTTKLLALPKLIVAKAFLEAGAAAIEPIEDALRAATPEQEGNTRGGYFDEPGSLKDALDSFVELPSNLEGVHAGVGYGEQSFIARLVDQGHQMVTHDGRTVGAVEPHPFIRRVFDGEAPERGIKAFAEVIERELPSVVKS